MALRHVNHTPPNSIPTPVMEWKTVSRKPKPKTTFLRLTTWNVENVSWVEIKERLKTLKNSEINLMDNDVYTRGQQAIDYVNRVSEYYKLLSAHACVAPKDQLVFF